MSAPLQGTASAAGAIERVRYTHDAMIDLIIANPGISQGSLAKHFGYTGPWISRIFNSDAFQARLAQRKQDLVDPTIMATLDEKMVALAHQSMDIVAEKLALTQNPDTAFKVLELTTKSLGYGARQQNVAVQQNFVVQMPAKAADAVSWAQKHAGGGMSAGQLGPPAEVVDVVEGKSPDLAALLKAV